MPIVSEIAKLFALRRGNPVLILTEVTRTTPNLYIHMNSTLGRQRSKQRAVPRKRKGRLVACQGALLQMQGVPCTPSEA